MKIVPLQSALAATILSLIIGSIPALANGPIRDFEMIVPFDPVVDANGDTVTDPGAPLYNFFCPEDPLYSAILAPDGHHVTLGEWTAARGRASVKCNNSGTQFVLHLKGLIPHGVYTLWIAVISHDGEMGAGAAGLPDGSQNTFTISATGEGQLSVVHPAGLLSDIPVEVGSCLLTDPTVARIELWIAYHMDGQTHGGLPGGHPGDPANCSWYVPVVFALEL